MASYKFSDKVNAIIQTRRGPEADRKLTKFGEGEIVYSIDKKRLFVGDGENGTSGGILVGNKVFITDSFQKLSQIQTNDLVYLQTDNSLYLLTGGNILEPSSYAKVGGVGLIPNQEQYQYTLPPAAVDTLGGVKPRDGLKSVNGLLYIDYDENLFEINSERKLSIKSTALQSSVAAATYNDIGLLKVEKNNGIIIQDNALKLSIDNNTIRLSSTPNGDSILYVKSSSINVPDLPIASDSVLGAVRMGSGLTANDVGTASLVQATNDTFGGLMLGDGLTANPITNKVDVKVNYSSTTNAGVVALAEDSPLTVNSSDGKLAINVDNSSIKIKLDEDGVYKLYADLSNLSQEEGDNVVLDNGTETPSTTTATNDPITTPTTTIIGGNVVQTTNNIVNIPENSYIKRLGDCSNSRGAYAAITNDNRVIAWGNLYQNLFGSTSTVVAAVENVRLPFWKNYDGYLDETLYKPYGGDFLDEESITNKINHQITDLYWSRYSAMALVKPPNSIGGDVWICGKNTKGVAVSGANPKGIVVTKYNNFLLTNETPSATIMVFNKDKDHSAVLSNSAQKVNMVRDITLDKTISSELSSGLTFYFTASTSIQKYSFNKYSASTESINNINFKYLNGIEMVTNDSNVNYLYVCDVGTNENKVKVYNLNSSTFSTIGNGASGTDDGINSSAKFKLLKRITADPSNKKVLYVTDDHRIRRLWKKDNGDWLVTTLSLSTGLSGSSDGTLTFGGSGAGVATFSNPYGIRVTNDGKRLYVVDSGTKIIRKIEISENTESTFSATCSTFVSGTVKTNAAFKISQNMTKDRYGNIYIADLYNNRIRKISYDPSTKSYGDVVTYAGNGTLKSTDNINRLSACFAYPYGIVYAEPLSSFFVTDQSTSKIRKINELNGNVTTVISSAAGYTNGDGVSAKFYRPSGIEYGVIDNNHYLWVSDRDGKLIRQINIQNPNTPSEKYVVSTIAGLSATAGNTGDGGLGTNGKIYTFDLKYYNNNLYFSNRVGHVIRKYNFLNSTLELVAGLSGSSGGNVNGTAAVCKFNSPRQLLIKDDALYVSDYSNSRIRKIQNFTDANINSRICSYFVGNGSASYSPNTVGLNASLKPTALLLDANNDIIALNTTSNVSRISSTFPNGLVKVNGADVSGFADTGTVSLDWEPYGLDYKDQGGIDKIYFSEIKYDTIGEVSVDGKVSFYKKITPGGLGLGVGNDKSTCGFIKVNAVDNATGLVPKFKRIQMAGDSEKTLVFAALDTDNSLWTWGNSVDGAFGVGLNGIIGPTKVYNFDKNVLDFSITASTTGVSLFSVITMDGKMYASGDNTYAQLGINQLSSTFASINQFTICKKNENGVIVDVTDAKKLVSSCVAGKKNNFYISSNGDLYACGDATYGMLGRSGSTSGVDPVFKKVDQLDTVKNVIVGGNIDYPIAMAVKENGELYAWGYNNSLSGQCLVNDTSSTIIYTPTPCYNYETKDAVNDAQFIYTNDNPIVNKAQFAYLDNKNNLYIGGASTETDIPDFSENIPYFRKYNMKNVSPDLNLNNQDAVIHRTNGTVYKIDRYGPKKLF